MDIKASPSTPVTASADRHVQPSRRSDSRQDEREAEFSRRDVAQPEQDRHATQPVAQSNEPRFFALEARDEAQSDPRSQVRAMRERVRQTYSEQENREARRAVQEQQAQAVQVEKSAQRDEARNPIDLIA